MYETEVTEKQPILFALSTCPRCQRMRDFLVEQGINVKVIEIDLLPFEEKQAHIRFVRKVNRRISFPTLVIGERTIVGEDYDGTREVLGL